MRGLCSKGSRSALIYAAPVNDAYWSGISHAELESLQFRDFLRGSLNSQYLLLIDIQNVSLISTHRRESIDEHSQERFEIKKS